MLILLIILMILNMKYQPFAAVVLNNLENVSIVTSLITIYCGIFFLSDTSQRITAAAMTENQKTESMLKAA